MMKAHVYVTYKAGVLDPQGAAVQRGLVQLGFAEVADVRVGKYLEVQLDGVVDRAQAGERLKQMCQKLLANPVIEDFRYEIVA
ncbi:MAG TPA: phosphoribosylformylglycinamidine synthase subunit PurS [Myxococcota bacterium]|jgi:phosphoribosylformylglycinamidine synthase|nr:phosphoribosylformylglycinamidine synthase subunit PurS [Myxococcota bacterium]